MYALCAHSIRRGSKDGSGGYYVYEADGQHTPETHQVTYDKC